MGFGLGAYGVVGRLVPGAHLRQIRALDVQVHGVAVVVGLGPGAEDGVRVDDLAWGARGSGVVLAAGSPAGLTANPAALLAGIHMHWRGCHPGHKHAGMTGPSQY